MRIDLYDGKYTYVCNDDGSDQHALRYGERWRDLVGDGFVLAMAQKIEELEQAQNQLLSLIYNSAVGNVAMGYPVDIEGIASEAYGITGVSSEQIKRGYL